MAATDNNTRNQSTALEDPGSKRPQDMSGTEPAEERKDVENPGDAGIGRVEQMQHADD